MIFHCMKKIFQDESDKENIPDNKQELKPKPAINNYVIPSETEHVTKTPLCERNDDISPDLERYIRVSFSL